jgi:two-component system OmpR family response regulator
MRILLIEDDLKVQAYIRKGLQEAGHTVDVSGDGKDGLFKATTENYDVLIIDRMLPGLDGLTIIKTLRGAENSVPILILSALGDVDDRVKGLRGGGDDYLVKPFAFAELLARVELLGKRKLTTPMASSVLTVQNIEMDLLARRVTRNQQPVELQGREFRLLQYLLQHKGQIVTRTMLLESVWDYHFDPQTNVIDVHISRLRKKIDSDGQPSLIKTVRGAGYIIEDA